MKELRTVIVGNNHRPLAAQERFRAMEENEILDLVREPDNQFDPLAIQVHTLDGAFIGYIPKHSNAALAQELDAGTPFVARWVEDRLIVSVDEESSNVD